MTEATAELHDVCEVDELEPGVVRVVELDGRPNVGVLRVRDGQLLAFGLMCPHKGGPLEKGQVRLGLSSRGPGDRLLDPEHCVLACPWHKWEFSLEDGRALFDKRRRLIMYPTVVNAGRVQLQLD
jgi:nitrite reductase/ring-hydroxylating ferredoxin subunit